MRLPPVATSVTDPTLKRPEFSTKNSRFSGKKRLNRVRFTCCSSASTCEKSVLAVRSSVKADPNPYFTSRPPAPDQSLRMPLVSLNCPRLELTYGLMRRFDVG